MRCEFCGKGVAQTWQLWDFWQFKPKSQQPICQDCWGKFTPIIGPTCQECGRASRQETCEDCQVWLGEGYPPLKNQALFKYDAMMHDFFQHISFGVVIICELFFKKPCRKGWLKFQWI
ncbi:double zinc ribbon domain-containing protein [Weissella confusa]|uniref:double zinc ribbon domain-containing protein n=1 Tax=Weissella confusa TaxID=1583 RepID=UPI0039829715